MKKKGQGISINTIIIAVIGLAVLAIIVAVTTGFFGGDTFEQAVTNDCTNKGGTCYAGTGCTTDKEAIAGTCGSGNICCRDKFFS